MDGGNSITAGSVPALSARASALATSEAELAAVSNRCRATLGSIVAINGRLQSLSAANSRRRSTLKLPAFDCTTVRERAPRRNRLSPQTANLCEERSRRKELSQLLTC